MSRPLRGRPSETKAINEVGVRDLIARGYSIPGGVSQRRGGQALMFRVARCQIRTQVSHPGWPRTESFGNSKVTAGIDHTPCTESRTI